MPDHLPQNPIVVRGTEILAADPVVLHRQKLARITLDSMIQFVGLLDAEGTVLEINQVALDGVGLQLADVEGNLLTNAAKYTPPGGHITVHAERVEEEVVLTVRDTGIGIAPDVLPRVFDLFVQERQGIDRSQGGLGLGLTIVRNFVERHGGSVLARSEGMGRGSEFAVRLPALAPVRPSEEPGGGLPPPPGEARRPRRRRSGGEDPEMMAAGSPSAGPRRQPNRAVFL